MLVLLSHYVSILVVAMEYSVIFLMLLQVRINNPLLLKQISSFLVNKVNFVLFVLYLSQNFKGDVLFVKQHCAFWVDFNQVPIVMHSFEVFL
jgi:hypothetical protein